MRSHLLGSALVLAAATTSITHGPDAWAAEWVRTSTPPSVEPPSRIAERLVTGPARDALRVGDAVLVRRAQVLEGASQSVVRFDQRHRGLPVEQRGAAVQVLRDGRVQLAMVDVAPGLDVDPTPALTAAEALDAARAAVLFPIGRMVRAELVVVAEGTGRLAWRIDAHDPRGGVRLLVDAGTGRLVSQRPLRSHAQGLVYAVSSVNTPEPTQVELATLDTTADPLRLEGWSGLLHVANYVSGGQQNGYQVEQTLGPTEGQDFLHPVPADLQDPTDGFAQVNLFHHLTTHRTFFRDVLGVALDAASWEVTAVANLQEGGQPMDNAFFSPMGLDGNGALNAPNMIGIGQGTIDFAYDSDVFKHEFGHYVSHNAVEFNLGQAGVTEYGLSPHSGSVDEGISDYFACSENGDPILGEASLDVLSAARDLEDTSKSCPGDMVGEVHADGEIVASLGWTLRELLGKELADRLVWGAVTLMPSGGTLGDFATGLVATANAMLEAGDLVADDVASIEAAIAARGLDQCGDVIPLTIDEPVHTTMFGLDIIGQAFGVPCAQLQDFDVELQSIFHFSGQAPDADAAHFHVDVEALGGGSLDYRILVRKDQHVTFDSGGGVGLPSPVAFDYEAAGDSGQTDLVIHAASDPPFDPSATYYAVVMTRSCPALGVDISFRSGGTGEGGGPGVTTGAGGEGPGATSAQTTGPTGGVGGGGGADDGGDSAAPAGDGCGCRTAGDTAPGGGAFAALGALAVAAARALRRRRG